MRLAGQFEGADEVKERSASLADWRGVGKFCGDLGKAVPLFDNVPARERRVTPADQRISRRTRDALDGSPPIRIVFPLTAALEHIENKLTTGNPIATVTKNDTGTAPMRKTVVRQNEFSRLCEQAGLTHQEAASLLSVSDRTIARYANGTGRPTALAMRVLCDAARSVATGPRPVSFRFIDLFAGIGGNRVFASKHRISLAG